MSHENKVRSLGDFWQVIILDLFFQQFRKIFTHFQCWDDKIDIMTAIPRQTKTPMCPVNFCFTATPEGHVRSILSQLGHEKQSYGTLMHDLEYQLR